MVPITHNYIGELGIRTDFAAFANHRISLEHGSRKENCVLSYLYILFNIGMFRINDTDTLGHQFFCEHTAEFYEFYRERMIALDAKPNQAHRKLAELEAAGKLTAVVTQNIDGLHQAAGSRNVFELHGSVHRNVCRRCGAVYSAEWILDRSHDDAEGVPHCPECGGLIKPDVVLYGESLDNDVVEGAIEAIADADLLIIGGTSLVVYPAAGLVQYFRGDHIAIVNKQPTPQDRAADLVCACDIARAFDF